MSTRTNSRFLFEVVQPPKDLSDLARAGGSIKATCRECQRVALWAPGELQAHFARKGWDQSFPRFAMRLRCSCGARGPRIEWQPQDPPPADPQPPRPRFVRERAGATVIDFGHERDKRRSVN